MTTTPRSCRSSADGGRRQPRPWGWEVKTPPARAHVTVPRDRNVPEDHREGVEVARADLPFDEARAVAAAASPEAANPFESVLRATLVVAGQGWRIARFSSRPLKLNSRFGPPRSGCIASRVSRRTVTPSSNPLWSQPE